MASESGEGSTGPERGGRGKDGDLAPGARQGGARRDAVRRKDAARYWRTAAQMGDGRGKAALGMCYVRGFGVRRDLERGVEIIRQAAVGDGEVAAMRSLAWVYRRGCVGEVDFEGAQKWEERANRKARALEGMFEREAALLE